MQIIIAIGIIVLLILAFYYRRRDNNQWRKEERYEESGEWLDKRSGERGTFGSLDREQEAERKAIYHKGQIRLLENLLQEIPNVLKTKDLRQVAQSILDCAQGLLNGKKTPAPDMVAALPPYLADFHKRVLAFIYAEKPAMLDLEVDQLKAFDIFVRNELANLV
jgi:hypothetical protein